MGIRYLDLANNALTSRNPRPLYYQSWVLTLAWIPHLAALRRTRKYSLRRTHASAAGDGRHVLADKGSSVAREQRGAELLTSRSKILKWS